MKPLSDKVSVQPGTFVRPSGAQLRSVPDAASLVQVWREVGPCLAYPKPDGWRIQVHKVGGIVKLFSRTGKDWAEEFPSIVHVLQAQVADDQAVLDTELVGFDKLGRHLEPAKLRRAAQYRCYVLDALHLNRTDLTPLPAQDRVSFIREHLHDAFRGILVFAEYTLIGSQEEWIGFYRNCQAQRMEGFDGAIIKRLDAPYFADVLKVKPEDTVDAVVVGAYQNKRGETKSLLLAVPDHPHKCWEPVVRVARTNTEDWDAVWSACQPYVLDHRLHDLGLTPDVPDIWIAPEVVVEAAVQARGSTTKNRLGVDLQCARCSLREDKGLEDATSFEQVCRIVGAAYNPPKMHYQLNLL